jgi:hypothetical protein
MKNRKNKIGLINFEGDCLTATKSNGSFLIEDQHKKFVAMLNRHEFNEFLNGVFSLSDSLGNTWNFSEVTNEAKPKPEDLEEFMRVMPKFNVGDKAFKPKGYRFPCTIVSVFETVNKEIRVVAEMDEYGLLHIFNEDQLSHHY